MDSKKIRKSLARFIAWVALILSSLTIKILPARYTYGFAHNIAFLGFHLAKKKREIALESLNIAFGKEELGQEIEQIAKECFVHMAKSGFELLFLVANPELIRERVEIVGKEYLDNALSKGRGAILVSAHFGNFPLMMSALAFLGYKISGIMRPMRDKRVEKFFIKTREKTGIKTIYAQPRNVCVSDTLKALRNNELVFIPLDQNFGTGGVFVDFFGQKAATATGPVIFARRSGAVLLPCFIVRQEDDRHKIIFEPGLELEEGRDSQESILINVQRLTNIIESYIRKYPAEWGWIHRRWKSKPS